MLRPSINTLGIVSALAVLGPVGVDAQQRGACPQGQLEMGTLGIGELECNCHFSMQLITDSGTVRRNWDFRSEPIIGRIIAGGPAAGRLRAGDVITAIDGHLITTREGGRRYGNLVPGVPVTLRVRRDGRELDVMVTAEKECTRITVLRPTAPAPPAAPRPSAEPRVAVPLPRPTAPEAPRPARPLRPAVPVRPPPSTPALGFSIECSDCSLQLLGEGEDWVWSFSEAPVVKRVEPGGPAHDAGLRAGDVLTHIDGVRLTSAEGGRRFGALKGGDRITLTYRRGAVEREATLVAREAASWGIEATPAVPVDPVEWAQPDITRFTGSLGDAVVQVTGGRVSVMETDDEIVIRSSDITVRITRSGGGT